MLNRPAADPGPPPVARADAWLAALLRDVQWLCDDLAHDLPVQRVSRDQVTALRARITLLNEWLDGYARRWPQTDDAERT